MKPDNNQAKTKIAVSFILISIILVIMVSFTMAWLDRTKNNTYGSGFSLVTQGTIMDQTYSIETFYLAPDDSWVSVTKDFVRQNDKTVDWTTQWDKNSCELNPGDRTEFKTVVKNLSLETEMVTLFFKDVSVNKNLRGKITVGVSDPEVHVYESTDPEYFKDDGESLYFDILPLCENQPLGPRETLTIQWYLAASADVAGGSFPVLADEKGNIITDDDGNCYFINSYDSDGKPSEAFLCDSMGVVIVTSKGLVEYEGNYAKTQLLSKAFGDVELKQKVSVSGIYVAIG